LSESRVGFWEASLVEVLTWPLVWGVLMFRPLAEFLRFIKLASIDEMLVFV